jgi:hypothetical protein
MRKKTNQPQQTEWAYIKSQRGAPNTPGRMQKLVACSHGKAQSLCREEGGKKWVTG